ncbi:MAG: DUF4446 family protein [Patescibacteria group bacterium]|nr:DUF4446 family protein [Patescibacteria group bacterium]
MFEITNLVSQNQEILIIAAAVILLTLLFWNIYLHYCLFKIKKRTRSFFESSEGKDLEEIIYKQIKKTNEVDSEIKKIIKANKQIKNSLNGCVQKVGVVRFNPFGDVGGNQSFVIALLDNSLSGVIIQGLYSREGVRVYSKQIKEGKSEYALGKEEEEAIKIADESRVI